MGRCLTLGCAAWLLLAACGGDAAPAARTLLDVGEFCVHSNDTGTVIFSVMVGPPEHCLSGCEASTTSCQATLTGTRIELRSRLDTRELPGVMECPAGCMGSRATCELEAPTAGDYQFGFASRFDTATLPIEGSVALFGDHTCDPPDWLLPNPYPSPPGPMSPVPEFESGAPPEPVPRLPQ